MRALLLVMIVGCGPPDGQCAVAGGECGEHKTCATEFRIPQGDWLPIRLEFGEMRCLDDCNDWDVEAPFCKPEFGPAWSPEGRCICVEYNAGLVR